MEDIRGLVIELEETRRRNESEVNEGDDSDETEEPKPDSSTCLLSQSLEEFNVAVAEIPEAYEMGL